MMQSKLKKQFILTDYIVANIAWFIFDIYRFYQFGILQGYRSLYAFLTKDLLLTEQLLMPFFLLFIHYLTGFYNNPYRQTKLTVFFSSLFSSLIGSLSFFFCLLLNENPPHHSIYYQLLGVAFTLFFLLTYLPRLFFLHNINQKIHSGKWGYNTLIIGTGQAASFLTENLNNSKRPLGYLIQGYCQVSPHEKIEIDNKKIIGSTEEIEQLIKQYHIQIIIIADKQYKQSSLYSLLNRVLKYNISIHLVSDQYDWLTGNIQMPIIYGTPLVSLFPKNMHEWERSVKQTCDYLFSALALLLLSPLYLFIACKIKSSSSGPIFYKQERIGLWGKPFYIYKFRSMYCNAEASGPQLTHSQNDERITPFGRILRKYHLDELPQFWNVLKGDMSIVGPRPERDFFIKQITTQIPYYPILQSIKPGITSWGMVKYGYADTVQKMVERSYYDILYLERASLVVDIRIIFYTIHTIFTGKGV